MLALSSRPWLGHVDLQRRFRCSRRCRTKRSSTAADFTSDQCPEGGRRGRRVSTLRIVSVERLGDAFNQTSCKLRYTPPAADGAFRTAGSSRSSRRISSSVPYDEARGAGGRRGGEEGEGGESAAKMEGVEGGGVEDDDDDDDDDEFAMTPAEQFGAPKAPPGSWASCLPYRPPRGRREGERRREAGSSR